MSEYIPTTEEVRIKYGLSSGRYPEDRAEFDRWLDARDDQIRAEALEEAATIAEMCLPEIGHHINVTQYRAGKFDGISIVVAHIEKAKGVTP